MTNLTIVVMPKSRTDVSTNSIPLCSASFPTDGTDVSSPSSCFQYAKQSQPRLQNPSSLKTDRCPLSPPECLASCGDIASHAATPAIDGPSLGAYPPYCFTGDQSGLTGSAGGAMFEYSPAA